MHSETPEGLGPRRFLGVRTAATAGSTFSVTFWSWDLVVNTRRIGWEPREFCRASPFSQLFDIQNDPRTPFDGPRAKPRPNMTVTGVSVCRCMSLSLASPISP